MAVTPGSLQNQQTQRRAKYGVNVALALVAAAALVLLMNWLAVWAFARLPDSVRPWLRYDLTATRAFTLSPQTRKVLAPEGLGEGSLEITGIYGSGTPQARAVDDLLAQYAKASPSVVVQRFDPQTDAGALRDFYGRLEEQLTGQSGGEGAGDAARRALDRGLEELSELNTALDGVLGILGEAVAALDATSDAERNIAQLVDGVAGGVVQIIDTNEQATGQIDAALAEPLPALSQLQTALSQRLQGAGGAAENLRRWLRGDAQNRMMPAAVRDAAIRADRLLEGRREALDAAQAQLASATVDAGYRRVRDAASRSASVLVRRGDRVRAVNLEDMFVADETAMDVMDPAEATAAQTLPVRFMGEERLTGAIVSVSLETPPLLVFASLDGRPALGRGGTHNVVAERVRAAGFEVASWPVVSVSGGASLNPLPVIEQGRRVVWMVPAAEANLPTDAAARARLAETLDKRLALGDGVLITPGLRVGASVVAEDPLLALAARRGVGVDAGALVLAPGVDERGAPSAMNTFRVQAFAEHAITAPLEGRSVWLDLAHPLTLDDGSSPLIALQAEGLWIESDPPTQRALGTATAEAFELASGPVPVAAVSSGLGESAGRLAVVGDSLWSTDPVIVNRQASGNVELFANLAYWLAGLDDAIDATPRSQGVRRIGPMSQGGRTVAGWLVVAGWPAVALAMGTAVWAVRRRS